jgi:cobalamin biosynthesis Mg chelatase CobN
VGKEALFARISPNIYVEREAMNAKDEVPNSPEVKVEQEPETPATSPVTMAPVTTAEATNEAAVPPESTDSVAASTTPATDSAASASEQIAQQVRDFVAKFVKQAQASVSGEQKSVVVVVLSILAAIPVVILAGKVLNFIDSLPLLEPLLKLIGLAYTVWFVYRYLLFANSRKELVDTVKGAKSKIFGDG